VLLEGKYLMLIAYSYSHTFLKSEPSISDLKIKSHMGGRG
jgi:hypothetical protein